MSPSNLGVVASQISGHLWAPSGAYDSIATTTVGSGGSATITFSSIPATYTHLQVRAFVRDAYGPFRFNSDTGANYTRHYLYGDGASVVAGSGTSQTSIDLITATSTASTFGVNIVDILDYTNTNKYKTVRVLRGEDLNGSGSVMLGSGLWLNTSAITSITFNATGLGGSFAQYTSLALYGIRGA